MPAAPSTDSKNEDKPTTTATDLKTTTKPVAEDTSKPKESAISSSPSSSAAPAEPTPSTSSKDEDKSREASKATSEEAPSTSPATTANEADKDDVIDMETFQQIIDLDDEDDETHEFARGMADAYFEQAVQTFKDMDSAYSKKNLGELSSLGHYLKGSSAALGLKKVQASCEDIQHYGLLRDETAGVDLKAEEALEKIQNRISQAKKDYDVAEQWLRKWFEDHRSPEEE